MKRLLVIIACLWGPGSAWGSATEPRKPTVAVLSLSAKRGVEKDVADLVLTTLVSTLRKSEAFSRVASVTELETLIGFERTRQLTDCNAGSCMAEIAGALGVDLIVSGEIGRVGESFVFSFSMLDPKTATTVASVSERLHSNSSESLLDAVEPMVRSVLKQAHLAHALPEAAPPAPRPIAAAPLRPAPATPVAPTAPVPPPRPAKKSDTTPAPKPAAVPAADERLPVVWWAVAGGGGAAVLASLLVGLPAIFLVYMGVGLTVRLFLLRSPFSGDVVGGAAALPVVLLSLLVGGAGVAAMVFGLYRAVL